MHESIWQVQERVVPSELSTRMPFAVTAPPAGIVILTVTGTGRTDSNSITITHHHHSRNVVYTVARIIFSAHCGKSKQ